MDFGWGIFQGRSRKCDSQLLTVPPSSPLLRFNSNKGRGRKIVKDYANSKHVGSRTHCLSVKIWFLPGHHLLVYSINFYWVSCRANYCAKQWKHKDEWNILILKEPLFKSSSVQFSHIAVSNSLWPHGLQHTRTPCPSPTPRVHPNPCPSNRWCHPAISSSVFPFSSHLQSFSASGSFPQSQFFTSGGQSIEVSAATSVLPMNIQDWFPLGWTG